jgi:hypothetical protein
MDSRGFIGYEYFYGTLTINFDTKYIEISYIEDIPGTHIYQTYYVTIYKEGAWVNTNCSIRGVESSTDLTKLEAAYNLLKSVRLKGDCILSDA